MPHHFQISVESQPLYITVVSKNRLPVFKTDKLKAVLCRAIDEARVSAGFLLFAYVIMIDHMQPSHKSAIDYIQCVTSTQRLSIN